MKKTILAASVLFCLGNATAATTPAPAQLPGGLSGKNVIHDSASTFNGQTVTNSLDTLNTTANAAIPKSWRGANTTSTVLGVAPLDSNAFSPSPLSSGGNLIGNWQSTTTPDLFSQGYESNLMGGVTAMGSGYLNRSLLIETDPYTNYSGGCGLLLSMMGSVGSQQFPISQQDYRGGASAVVGVGGYDTVANCILTGNQPARFVLTATGYTATSVKLASALSAGDAARIWPGMYITTNSPNTDLTITNTDGELPGKNLYAGFVSAQPQAGDTSISVYAWDVPGYGTGASGQVPQTTTLDTVWSARTSPTVWLGGGAAGSSFTNNWFTSVDVNNLKPSTTNLSLIHQFTPVEIDLNLVNGTAPDNSIWWQGIGMNAGNQPAALTTDSRQIFLGGDINHHLITNGGCGNWDIESWADGGYIALPSLCNLAVGSAVEKQVVASWTNWAASANKVTTMITHSVENATAATGWQQVVVHLGVTVDGNRVQTGDYGGSKQGDIEWNQGGNYGSISLCGYSTTCGFRVNGDGTAYFAANAYMGNGIDLTFFPKATGVAAPYLHADGAGTLAVLSSAGGRGTLEAGAINSDGNASISGSVTAAGFDSSSSGYMEDGSSIYFKPETLSNNLQPALHGLDSYTIAANANTSANVSILASTLQAADGGTGSFSSAGRSVWQPDGYGNWAASYQSGTTTLSGGAIKAHSYTLATLPTTNETDGNQLWCSDCKLNSITGVAVYWHSSASKWTDSQNNTLSN